MEKIFFLHVRLAKDESGREGDENDKSDKESEGGQQKLQQFAAAFAEKTDSAGRNFKIKIKYRPPEVGISTLHK
ncbi:hypothetical protein H5410_063876 [Solanum commersonii]|uniref:Uncharacterized protein n=1 Tax=Solanum commersonii TaxID=4109 RepID=A0A9J5WGZ1_SOLCO|nr:hypothetical protein H5410_063876 [Solanum commersonii]